MKRVAIILVVLAIIALLLLVINFASIGTQNAPSFVSVRTQPTGPFRTMFYDWGGPVPVRDGKVWITVQTNPTNVIQQFLYDLEQRRVIGELRHGSPIFSSGDGTKVLCQGYGSMAALKWRFTRWLRKYSFGRTLADQINNEEEFWVLNLKNNSAIRVGRMSGSGNRFLPAPGFRLGYTKSFGSIPDIFVCDLESCRLKKIKIDGDLSGWWDEQNILFKDLDDNFKLHNVATGETKALHTSAAMAGFLKQFGLSSTPADVSALCHWNGSGYDILFTEEKQKNWGTSFILKAARQDGKLELLYRDFKFEWGGCLDADESHYLFSGESGAPGQGGNGAVYLRDLKSNTTRTLIEPDNGRQYSLARFCSDGVLYWHKKNIWRVDFDGTKNGPLIPPASGQ